MKKVLVLGMLAIACLALSQQQASAWINARLGLGFNIGWQSGGNTVGWGAWRGGQPPGPEVFGGHHGHFQGYATPNFYSTPLFDSNVQMPSPSVPNVTYSRPYQVTTYPRPVYYYYPAPYYYGR